MKKSILTRLFALLLTLILALGAVGCGAKEIIEIIDVVDSVVNQPGDTSASSDTASDDTSAPVTSQAETKIPQTSEPETQAAETEAPEEIPDEDRAYTSKDDVALYIHTYGRLPSNFITKTEARKLGWSGGSLEPYASGCSIGGDTFGNREGLLPSKKGRTYTECDIDTAGQASRGAKRIVFSNDGLIYYTDDHYESFTLLYGEE